jgi:hypothetical protein
MNSNTTRDNSEVNASCRRSNDTRHSKPLFVMVSQFNMDNFPVGVRDLRLAQTKVSKTSSGVSGLERRGIPQC